MKKYGLRSSDAAASPHADETPNCIVVDTPSTPDGTSKQPLAPVTPGALITMALLDAVTRSGEASKSRTVLSHPPSPIHMESLEEQHSQSVKPDDASISSEHLDNNSDKEG